MNNDNIGYIALIISLLFFVVIASRYYRYWKQLKGAVIKSGAEWPLHTQGELNQIVQSDLISGYGIIFGDLSKTLGIMFSMRSDDPDVRKALWGLRRTLITFCLFPFILAFVLVIVATFSADSSSAAVTNTQTQSATSTEQGWITYKNEPLGISFSHPESVNGKEMVFFQVGNALFVTVDSSPIYLHRDELTSTDYAAVMKSEQELEQKYSVLWGDTPWMIVVQDANGDKGLNAIIQDYFGRRYKFGDGCTLGSTTPSSVDGVYDVGVDPVRPGADGKYDANSSCFINWMVSLKYSHKYNRAAIWDLGQDSRFTDNDRDISKTFNFIDK